MRTRLPLSTLALVVGFGCWLAPLQAAGVDPLDRLREEGLKLEEQGQWFKACELYAQILRGDRALADIKERYQLCLRHIHQLRRHRDPGFREAVLNPKLKFTQTLDIYQEVLFKVQAYFLDRDKTDVTLLYQQGLLELRFALEDSAFVRAYMAQADPDKVRVFTARLEQWQAPVKRFSRQDAREQLMALAQHASRELDLNPAVVVFEFVCGAITSLDEYAAYLPPRQFADLQAARNGDVIGIGVELGMLDNKLIVTKVHPNSPAAAKDLKPGDQLTHLDKKPVANLAFDLIEARLRGKPGTLVELKVYSLGDMLPRTVVVERRPFLVRSVEDVRLLQEGVGYFKLTSFQKATVQEIREAVLQLQTDGMKVLILDLRGNPGGSFEAAVEASKLFLPDGIVVFTQSRLPDWNATHKANNPNALLFPLIVLVDDETASAAEVLAGALKENQRATLIGQTTFGKGTVQDLVALEQVPAGIRLTVAKFFSPANYCYHGRGVTPHLLVKPLEMDDMDAPLTAARQAAQQLVMMVR